MTLFMVIFYIRVVFCCHFLIIRSFCTNCIVLIRNPDWRPDDPQSTRLALATTMKVEKLQTYRLLSFYRNSEPKAEPEKKPYVTFLRIINRLDISRAHVKYMPDAKV